MRSGASASTPPAADAEPPPRSPIPRALACGVAFALTLGLLVGWGWRHRAGLRSEIETLVNYDAALEKLRAAGARRAPVPRVVVFGDSLLRCKTVDVPGLLGWSVRAGDRPVQILRADDLGFRPLQFYYLLDAVIATEPSVAVVEVNVGALPNVGFARQIRYLSLSRTLSFAQALRVHDALAQDDLSVLDPWLYRLEARHDLLYVSDGIQSWARRRLDDAGGWVNHRLGLRTSRLDLRAARLAMAGVDATAMRRIYDVDQARAPMTGVLREVYRGFRRAGVDVQFWVAPINVDRLADVGVRDELDLPARIERIRIAVGATPEEWLDLHALHPKDVLADWAGHAKPEGCQRTAERIAAALAARGLPRAVRPPI
jgi:hypothetical protein